MALRAPKKGSVEWHPLPSAPAGYEDVTVGIKYVGAYEARRWAISAGRIDQEERARRLKNGNDDVTSDFIESLDNHTQEVLRGTVAGFRGVEGLDENDAVGALELLEWLGEDVQAGTYSLAQAQQSLKLREKFRAASPSVE